MNIHANTWTTCIGEHHLESGAVPTVCPVSQNEVDNGIWIALILKAIKADTDRIGTVTNRAIQGIQIWNDDGTFREIDADIVDNLSHILKELTS